MIQLVDHHRGLSLLLLLFGEIHERSEMLNNLTALIPNRLMKMAAQNMLPSLRR